MLTNALPEGNLVQHTPMAIGWLTCISQVLLPHSLCRSATANAPANRPMPIASVVRWHSKKRKKTDWLLKNLWETVRFYDINRWVLLSRICAFSCICSADNSSQILKERIGLLAFATTTFNERNSGNGDFRFENKKTKFDFFRLRSLAGWKWFSSVRQEKKLDELTLGFPEFVRLRAESA